MADVSEFSIHCQNCSFSHLCLPVALNKTEIASLDTIVERKKPLQKGAMLVQLNDHFSALYAVRSGSFKSFITNQEGDEQIIGFHFPGDIIGFDALREQRHQSFTQALETAMVCELPYDMLDAMSQSLPTLRRQILSFMSAEIKQDHDMMMLLNRRTAQERLLYFIAQLSSRFAQRGFSHRQFHLTMTRNEIGNYLGLTVETISRLLTRFQKEDLIEVTGKLIVIKDFDGVNNQLKTMELTVSCQ